MPSDKVEIRIKRLNNGAGLPLPVYASTGAAGMDICAAEAITLKPGKRAAVPTGFAFAIPHGDEIQVRPRSGLALKHGITCLNTPGTIDSDYRGPLGVSLINLGTEPYTVRHGDRVAQVVVAPVVQFLTVTVASNAPSIGSRSSPAATALPPQA